MTPVVQDPQTRVDGTCHRRGHVINIIHCLIHSRVGIQVGTKLYTDGLQVFTQTVTWEVSRAIETHMLQEMCQSTLVGFLLDSTHLLCDIEVGTVFRFLIVADVIG